MFNLHGLLNIYRGLQNPKYEDHLILTACKYDLIQVRDIDLSTNRIEHRYLPPYKIVGHICGFETLDVGAPFENILSYSNRPYILRY